MTIIKVYLWSLCDQFNTFMMPFFHSMTTFLDSLVGYRLQKLDSLFLAVLFYGLKLFKETVKLFLWKITISELEMYLFSKLFFLNSITLSVRFWFWGQTISEFTNNFIFALKCFKYAPQTNSNCFLVRLDPYVAHSHITTNFDKLKL